MKVLESMTIQALFWFVQYQNIPNQLGTPYIITRHDDVIKWKHFPCYWPFVRGIHRSPVNSPHKDQWRGALMFSLICVWINGWVNNGKAGDLRRYRAHYDVTVMKTTYNNTVCILWGIYCNLTNIDFRPSGWMSLSDPRFPNCFRCIFNGSRVSDCQEGGYL